VVLLERAAVPSEPVVDTTEGGGRVVTVARRPITGRLQ
jgi:hypothetical protein